MVEMFKLIGTILIDGKEANEEIDNTVDNAEKSKEKINSAFKKVGTAVAGAFAVDKIKDFGVACVNTADGITSAMGSFSASTGVSGQALEEYEGALKNIYKANYGESFEDIAAAMAEVKQQAGDIGADSLEAMTTDAIVLRDTFDFEVNETMRATKMLMDQFGLSSKQAFNMIAQGAQNGLNKNGDLLDSINEYSVHYKQLGLTADQFFNSLANGTEAGTFSVDKLGDAMKEFGIRVKDGSDSTAEAFKYLGYDSKKLFKTFNKGGEDASKATQKIIDKLISMPDGVEKTTAGVALFGTMWEDLGEKGIAALGNLNGDITKTKDALTGINEVKYSSLSDALGGLKRVFETSVLVPLGEKLIPVVENLIDKIPEISAKVEELQQWFTEHKETIETVAATLAILTTAVIAYKAAMAIGGIINTVTTAMQGMTVAQYALNLAMSLNPVGIVIAAITALVAAFLYLWNNVDGFKEFWIDAWNNMLDFVGDCIEGVQKFFKDLEKNWAKTWDNIVDFLGTAVEKVKGFFNKIINFVKNNWQGLLLLLVNPFAGAFKLLYDNCDSFRNKIDSTFENVKNIIKKAIDKVKSFLNFKWKFPDLKLPHFSISGSANPLDWIEKGVPKLAVEWYAKGALLKSPTAFGINADTGSLMVGGEAGTEVIAPVSELNGMIRNAVNNNEVVFYLQQLIEKVNNLIDVVGAGDVVLYNYLGTDLLEEKIIKAQQSIALRSGGRA